MLQAAAKALVQPDEAFIADADFPAGLPSGGLLVNGRFLTRAPTGVDRCATEMVRALARLIRTRGGGACALDIAVPAGAPPDAVIRDRLDLSAESRIHRSRRSGYLWEQVDLAFLRRKATLLSFCNLGPILRRNQFALIHDAQVYDAPGSYKAPFRLAYRFLQPRLARKARWVATVSEFSRSRLRSNGVGASRPIEILHNGADHIAAIESDQAALSRFSLTPRGYLLMVGSMAAHKNIDLLIRACQARADRSIPLVVTGAGDPRVMGRGSQDGDDGVRFIGRVSDAELKALYENALIFLFPSLTEGFGLPPLEAMACGCPVIASTGGAIPGVCGEAAIYCDPRDQAGWTREIERVQADSGQLDLLARRGRARANAFGWETSASRLLEILAS